MRTLSPLTLPCRLYWNGFGYSPLSHRCTPFRSRPSSPLLLLLFSPRRSSLFIPARSLLSSPFPSTGVRSRAPVLSPRGSQADHKCIYVGTRASETKRNYARKQLGKQRRSPPVEIAARPTLVLPSPSGWRWPPLEEDGEAGGKSEIGSGENDDARFAGRCCWLPRFGLPATIDKPDQQGPRYLVSCFVRSIRNRTTPGLDAALEWRQQTEKRKLRVAMTSLVALSPTLDEEDALARSPPDEQGRREKGCLEGVRGRDGESAAFVFVHVASTSSSSSSTWARHSIGRGE